VNNDDKRDLPEAAKDLADAAERDRLNAGPEMPDVEHDRYAYTVILVNSGEMIMVTHDASSVPELYAAMQTSLVDTPDWVFPEAVVKMGSVDAVVAGWSIAGGDDDDDDEDDEPVPLGAGPRKHRAW